MPTDREIYVYTIEYLPDNAFLSSSLEINPGSCPCGPVADPIINNC